MKLGLLLLFVHHFLGSSEAGEWLTTGGGFCIDKCRYHDDQYAFYWCHVSDPTKQYSDGSSGLDWFGWDDNTNSPGTHLKWDYCVPSEMEELEEYITTERK